MGLIKAIAGAAGGALADQWKEFFYCDSLDENTLMVKGQKQITSRSSNTKGNDNIISNGSGIAVADGQCMLIVEQGRVVEVCAEPGQFTFDSSTEPSIFEGGLGKGIIDTFKTIGKRFTYGGDTGKDQRVYYINTKEILNNRFGTPTPIPFRVVDSKIGLDVDVSVRCNGIYTYKIANPLLFYTNLCANVSDSYTRDRIDPTLKSELINYLAPAFAKLSDMEVRPNQIPSKNIEICDSLKEQLSEKWGQDRGIEIASISFNSATIPDEDSQMIKNLQKTAVFRDPTMGAAHLVGAQGEAMVNASKNEAGAMTGFMGFGFAQNAANGMNAQSLYAMGQQNNPQPPRSATPSPDAWKCECGAENTGKFCQNCGKAKPAPVQAEWKCSCGAVNTGKFCTNCGNSKPVGTWKCVCGAENSGKFCQSCGRKKPDGAPLYRCDKCGWEPEDPKNPPKFCPECGDKFDESDIR